MVFQYNPISRSKYKYINTLRWFQTSSHLLKAKPKTLLNEAVEDRKVLKRAPALNAENQHYLIKRSEIDYSA